MSDLDQPPHWRIYKGGRVIAQFQWEWRDLWVGLFWRTTDTVLHLYICLVPLVPLHIAVLRKRVFREKDGDVPSSRPRD